MTVDTRDGLWLDALLGDPLRDAGPFGFRSAVELDEREAFPDEAVAALDALGLCRHYVPRALGGELDSFEHLACLLRTVARRDLTLAIGHAKTLLGTQPVFVSGDTAVKERVAARVLAGEPIALGLTERGSGTDLVTCTTSVEGSERPTIRGEKWLINNATRGTGLTVFARTRPSGGPRGFSLFFLDKRGIEGAYTLLPKIPTHGIRGADISGIRFDDARCDAPPLGGEGFGLATLLKIFTVTRTLIPSTAVGAVDSALRIVVNFARERRIYGGTVLEIPHARGVLCEAVAEIFACEAASLVCARALHVVPDQASFWASVVKYQVPTTMERLLRSLAVVLGARHYLREGHAHGMFQKTLRDVGILSVFDGNTLVNLSNIALHAAALARGDEAAPAFLDAVRLLTPVPPFDASRVTLMARAVRGPEGIARDAIERLDGRPHAAVLRALLTRLASRATAIRGEMAGLAPRNAFDMTPRLVSLASEYADLAVAALAASAYAHGPASGGAMMDGDWLVVFLAHHVPDEGLPPSLVEHCQRQLIRIMLDRAESGQPLSLLVDRQVRGSQ